MEKFDVHGENEIGVKRFYLPLVIETNCPHCNEVNRSDFEDNYLSYPTTNKKEPIYVCCVSCDKEYEFDVSLSIALEVDKTTRKI